MLVLFVVVLLACLRHGSGIIVVEDDENEKVVEATHYQFETHVLKL